MNIKFLYCKYENLKTFITSGGRLRFTDIRCYSNLENIKIRDDESIRTIKFNNIGFLKIGDHIINPKDIKNASLGFPTRRAHVLCLSNLGYSTDLYERFNADVCIAIDVDLLIEIVKTGFGENNGSVEVIGKDVNYYKDGQEIPADRKELVFWKRWDPYHVESEYRIAIFYLYDDNTIYRSPTGEEIRLFGEHDFIEVGIDDDEGMKRIIVETKKKDGC